MAWMGGFFLKKNARLLAVFEVILLFRQSITKKDVDAVLTWIGGDYCKLLGSSHEQRNPPTHGNQAHIKLTQVDLISTMLFTNSLV